MVQGEFEGSKISGQRNIQRAEGIDSHYQKTAGRGAVRTGGQFGHQMGTS
jgi:hypothetical protein